MASFHRLGRACPAAIAALFCASIAASADEETATYRYRASAFVGAFIPQSVSWSGAGNLGGAPVTAKGKLSSGTGFSTGGLLGLSFEDTPGWEWLNIDLEAGYVTSHFDHFSGNLAITGVGAISGDVPLAGNFHTYAGFLNFLATPFGVRKLGNGKITPFIGVGPGIARSTASLQSFALGGITIPVGIKSSETDFAAAGSLGFDYALSPQWDLGVVYQYTWIDTSHLGSSASLAASTGASTAHSVGLVLEYRFGKNQ